MDSNYLIILFLLLGLLASTVPVFLALFFTGLVGLVLMVGIDPQIVIEVLFLTGFIPALLIIVLMSCTSRGRRWTRTCCTCRAR